MHQFGASTGSPLGKITLFDQNYAIPLERGSAGECMALSTAFFRGLGMPFTLWSPPGGRGEGLSAEIEAADVECLFQLWERQSAAVAALGVDSAVVRRRAFITPSCGTGSLTDALSRKVLELTRALSLRIRQQ